MRDEDPIDQTKRYFRSNDRFFQVNGEWYFSTREGDIGPFRSRVQAKREVEAYVAVRLAQSGRDKPGPLQAQRVEVIPGFVYRSVQSMQQRVGNDRDLTLEVDGF